MSKIDEISLKGIVTIREKLLEMQNEGKKVFRFESGDPNFNSPIWVKEAIHTALLENHTHYPPNAGIPELRKAIAKKLVDQNKLKIDSDHVYVTNGAMHGLHVLFQCILEPGDEVIFPKPMWKEAVENSRLAGGVPIEVDAFDYTAPRIGDKIGPRTKAIFLNTPHNPTGTVIPKEELRAIAKLAKDSGIWLICDEAYEHIIYDQEHYSACSGYDRYDKWVSVYSFSKSYAMSGLRVGYLASPNELFKNRVLKSLRCTINGVNQVAQYGALAALKNGSGYIDLMMDEYRERRTMMYEALKDHEIFEPIKPEGGFFMWCNLKGVSEDAVVESLQDQGIGCAPGSCFGASEPSVRFAFSCSTEMVEEGSELLKQFKLNQPT